MKKAVGFHLLEKFQRKHSILHAVILTGNHMPCDKVSVQATECVVRNKTFKRKLTLQLVLTRNITHVYQYFTRQNKPLKAILAATDFIMCFTAVFCSTSVVYFFTKLPLGSFQMISFVKQITTINHFIIK